MCLGQGQTDMGEMALGSLSQGGVLEEWHRGQNKLASPAPHMEGGVGSQDPHLGALPQTLNLHVISLNERTAEFGTEGPLPFA